MFDHRIDHIREAINKDETAVQKAISDGPTPSGWEGPLLDTYTAHRRLLTLAEEYRPELRDGDDGEAAWQDVMGVLADLYRVKRPHRGDRSGWPSGRRH